jgi:hypothetical protein
MCLVIFHQQKRQHIYFDRIFTIPDNPALRRNSTTPIEPLVNCDAMVPKLMAGARQAKYKNRIAGII